MIITLQTPVHYLQLSIVKSSHFQTLLLPLQFKMAEESKDVTTSELTRASTALQKRLDVIERIRGDLETGCVAVKVRGSHQQWSPLLEFISLLERVCVLDVLPL